MKITRVIAREIYNSRGLPSLECEIVLEDGHSVIGSVATGASVGSHEAKLLLDEKDKRMFGRGVHRAIDVIEQTIAPLLIGRKPDAVNIDMELIALDGTEDKSRLGANTTLAISKAMYKAHAYCENLELYQFIAHLCGFESVMLPRPFINLINGGMHASNNLLIQEYMIVPIGAHDFRSSYENSVAVFFALKKVLEKYDKSTLLGDEGGFAPLCSTILEPLDYILEAIESVSSTLGISNDYFALALDIAATQFYDNSTKKYLISNESYSSDEMIEWYVDMLGEYPICSIEDGLAEDDFDGWQTMTKILGKQVQLVGDDLFATNNARIAHAIDTDMANTVIIKPSQIGTVTESIQGLRMCQENDYNVIASHRSGETEDTFISDFAVGTCAGQIKIGGCARGERVSKYNRLLRIEDKLADSLLEPLDL